MKKLLTIAVFVLLTVMIVGCSSNGAGFENGFEIGRGQDGGGTFAVAVRSDVLEFDVNNVTLEFFYGWNDITVLAGD